MTGHTTYLILPNRTTHHGLLRPAREGLHCHRGAEVGLHRMYFTSLKRNREPEADMNPLRHCLISSRGPASQSFPIYGCGFSSSSPLPSTLQTPSLLSISLPSTNGPARSNPRSASMSPSGSSPSASLCPTYFCYTDGSGQFRSSDLEACRRAIWNR